jgi:type 1 fimbriae regulatory protein FimE
MNQRPIVENDRSVRGQSQRLILRHLTGFKLANQGVDTRSLQHYLGHKNIQHTVRYSELSPERFHDFWRD